MTATAASVDATIGRLYDTVVDPSSWPDVLRGLIALVDADGAMLMDADLETGAGGVVTDVPVDDSVLHAFHAHYAGINPLVLVDDVAGYAAGWRPIMLRDDDCLDRAALERSEYYNDFLRPLNLSWGLYLRLGLHGAVLTTISLGRRHAAGRFTDAEMGALAAVHSHAIRAAALGRRFAGLGRFAAGAKAAMDAADDPLMLLDADGDIVHVNSSGGRLLGAGALLRTAGRGLAPASRHAGAELADALARAADPRQRRGATVTLIDGGGHRAAQASILPVSLSAALEAASGAAVLVRVGPLKTTEQLDAVMDGYRLTRAERALAVALVDGLTLRDAAIARGISVNTARCQLARLFDKTGVKRQLDLVRLLTRPH